MPLRPFVVFAALIALTSAGRTFAVEPAPAKNEFKLSETEQAVLDQTNAQRKAAGLPALTVNEALTKAARSHSEDMAKRNQLGHSFGGKGPADRVQAAGYVFTALAENCAAGQRTATEAVGCWVRSPGHRANLLGGYAEIGLGVATAADGTVYWTQVFGAPAGK